MAEEKSPYDSYDDATNAANAADDADSAKHRKDGEADSGANETLESLKAAGSSAFGLAKEFTNRFREDRAAQSEVSDAADPTDGTESGKKGSFFDRATEFAKNVSGSVRRAAEETRETETYSDAKEKAGSAFGVVREEASDAVNTVKDRMNERKEAKAAENGAEEKPVTKGDDVADPTAEVVDGEVISSEDDTK